MTTSIEERVARLEQDNERVAGALARALMRVRDLERELDRVERDHTLVLMGEVQKLVRRDERLEAIVARHLALGLDSELLDRMRASAAAGKGQLRSAG